MGAHDFKIKKVLFAQTPVIINVLRSASFSLENL